MKFFVTLAMLASLVSGQEAFAQGRGGNTQTHQQTQQQTEGTHRTVERQQTAERARQILSDIRTWNSQNGNTLSDSQVRRLMYNMATNTELATAAEARMKDTDANNKELNKIALQAMSYVGRDVIPNSGSKAESFANFAINALGTDAATMSPSQRANAMKAAEAGIAQLRANAGNFEGAMDAVATEVAKSRGTQEADMARVKQEIIDNIRNLCKKA